ncbi:MAG TPA: hypothetical protein VFC79_03705, partial [Tissierellaceae bacterium]|nr:hypothetical protein [Tissierellaceae bacterium]
MEIIINHSSGELILTDKDLMEGSLEVSEGTQSSQEFSVGGTVASDIKFTFVRKEEYDDIDFMGARIKCHVGMLIRQGKDAHFLQPSQPSKMLGYEDLWEEVPLGFFNVDVVDIHRTSISLKGIDNMVYLDKPYSLSTLSYPVSLFQIYTDICSVADIVIGTTDFPNKDYVVQNRPSGDSTLRDVVGYVAELTGTFAKVNRYGALELKWYEETDIHITPETRFSFTPSTDEVSIKGVMFTEKAESDGEEDVTYLVGEENFALDLSSNPLVSGEYTDLLNGVFNNIKDTVFTPYSSDWVGNPAVEAGDMIKHTSVEGNEYNTLVTKKKFKYRGKEKLDGVGLPEISKGFQGGTDRRLAIIQNKIDKEVGNKISNLEQAQLNATELMANMLGGYKIEDKENGIIYIADNPILENATKIWKWGLNGFGYSSNGGLTWETAITADGSIVAELVSAGIISADMVNTGILQANNGKSYFDLDNGILRISHGGVEHSQVDINGMGRKFLYGDAQYLSGIYVHKEGQGS